MFCNKNKRKVKELEKEIEIIKQKARDNKDLWLARDKALRDESSSLKEKLKITLFEDLMREALGMPINFSVASKEKCMPPHYLQGLSDEERKNFVSDMETIYSNEKFQKVVEYMINVFAMNAVFKEDKDEMKYGQIAVMALRSFSNRFEEMHKEFLELKRDPEEEFDDQDILPR